MDDSTQPGGTRVSKEEAPAPGAQEKNKALVRRFFEARGKGDLDALEELFWPPTSSTTACFLGQDPRDARATSSSQLPRCT